MSFHDVDDPSALEVAVLGQHTEVMMVGEMSALDVELVEDMSGSGMLNPHILDVCVLEFVVPVMVVLGDLSGDEAPMGMDVRVDLNNGVTHAK